MWCCSEMGRHQRSSFSRRRGSVIDEPFALTRESLFFACAKKSNQKKAHPGDAPSALRAAGPQAGPEFSEGMSMCPPKTARILRAARWVYPCLLAASKGPRNSSNSRCGLKGHIPSSPSFVPGSP